MTTTPPTLDVDAIMRLVADYGAAVESAVAAFENGTDYHRWDALAAHAFAEIRTRLEAVR